MSREDSRAHTRPFAAVLGADARPVRLPEPGSALRRARRARTRLPGEPLRSLSFSASAHLQTRAHLSPLQPGCSRCSLDYTLRTAMQSGSHSLLALGVRLGDSWPGARLPTDAPQGPLPRGPPAACASGPRARQLPKPRALCTRRRGGGHRQSPGPGADARLAACGVLAPPATPHAPDLAAGPASHGDRRLRPPSPCPCRKLPSSLLHPVSHHGRAPVHTATSLFSTQTTQLPP